MQQIGLTLCAGLAAFSSFPRKISEQLNTFHLKV
jgi:hypothetical protein